MTDTSESPVVVYTLPEHINRLHIQRVENHMILIPTQSGNPFDSIHDKMIKINILEDIVGLLKHTPRDIEIRFPLDPSKNIEIDQIVEYVSDNIRIGVLSYVYKLDEHLLIIHASFIK